MIRRSERLPFYDRLLRIDRTMTILDPQLLEILVCPLTRSRLRQEGEWLVAETGGLRYPIQDGIPVLLVDKAQLPSGIQTLEEFKARYAAQVPV